jgi:hypothetical protein
VKRLILLFIILPFFSLAQEYTEVVEIPGKTAGQLYCIARAWFAKSFISIDNALLMDDRISGKIIAKGSVHISESYGIAPVVVDWYPNFTIEVSFKDGKYKNEISDLSITTDVHEGNSDTIIPFKKYLDKKEYYKNRGDTTWLINNPPPGIKIRRATAKTLAQPNQAIYNLICKTESEMNVLLSKLREAMKKPEAEW